MNRPSSKLSTKPKTKRGRGRPRKDNNFLKVEPAEFVQSLAETGATEAYIALKLGITPETLRANFYAAFQRGRAKLFSEVQETAFHIARNPRHKHWPQAFRCIAYQPNMLGFVSKQEIMQSGGFTVTLQDAELAEAKKKLRTLLERRVDGNRPEQIH